ncbi:hypothetical protein ACI65C_012198 [Semiaphis heraclei]
MSSFKSSKRNLSSSSSKDGDNKNKIFVSPNRYASLSEDADPHPEVFSPPPVTTSPQVEDISTHTYMKPPPTTKLHIPPFHVSGGYDFYTLRNSLFKVLEPSTANNGKLPTPINSMPSSKNRSANPNSTHNNRSYANITANTPPEDTPLISINKFLEEFKTIINPLIILLTSVLNRLQPVTVSMP